MRKRLLLLTMLPVAALLTRCGDDEELKTVPSVTTLPATNIQTNSVTLAGEVTDDGNVKITAIGFVYSSIVAEPTLADDKITLTSTDHEFTAVLDGLSSGTTYHVRAYATNSKGTAYGTPLDVPTGNAAPTVTGINITGDAEVNKTLTATYTYNDAEGDAEGATSFQWYAANNATGTGETAIAGATQNIYIIAEAQQGKYIRVGVTPKAATGNLSGSESKSNAVGAVGEATTVNWQGVTYGIINSTTTGRKWLDRNLGAANTPSSTTDYANYGDLFQWGRLADGHQIIVRVGVTDANASGKNGATSPNSPWELSSTDNPGHIKFIITPNEGELSSDYDWRKPQNNNLWQGVNGINNPCPAGWRLATQNEWAAEAISTLDDGFTKLKLTKTGWRQGAYNLFFGSETGGFYWTSTVSTSALDGLLSNAIRVRLDPSYAASSTSRGNGFACRCIKD